MKFTLRRTSDPFYKEPTDKEPTDKVEIESLDDLRAIQTEHGPNLIVNFGGRWDNDEPYIEIYDDHRE